jgi:hypothetical protein
MYTEPGEFKRAIAVFGLLDAIPTNAVVISPVPITIAMRGKSYSVVELSDGRVARAAAPPSFKSGYSWNGSKFVRIGPPPPPPKPPRPTDRRTARRRSSGDGTPSSPSSLPPRLRVPSRSRTIEVVRLGLFRSRSASSSKVSQRDLDGGTGRI